MIVYAETSAVAKLLVDEPESPRIAAWLDDAVDRGDGLLSCVLLETELRRLVVRLGLDQSQVTALLDRFDLVEPDRSVYREAGVLPGPHLRSLDGLHVAVALRADADTMLTYDLRQADAARRSGLPTVAP